MWQGTVLQECDAKYKGCPENNQPEMPLFHTTCLYTSQTALVCEVKAPPFTLQHAWREAESEEVLPKGLFLPVLYRMPLYVFFLPKIASAQCDPWSPLLLPTKHSPLLLIWIEYTAGCVAQPPARCHTVSLWQGLLWEPNSEASQGVCLGSCRADSRGYHDFSPTRICHAIISATYCPIFYFVLISRRIQEPVIIWEISWLLNIHNEF